MSKQNDTLEATICRIAREILDIETLETRRMDALDFHEVAVWQLRQALEAAYVAGQADRKGSRGW